MGKIGLSVQIRGDLLPDAEISDLIGIPPTVINRKGELISSKNNRVWQTDNLTIELTPDLDFDSTQEKIRAQFSQAEVMLQKIALNIAALSHDRFSAKFYVICIREEQQGGFTLSQELVSAIAMAKMEICVLVFVSFEDE